MSWMSARCFLGMNNAREGASFMRNHRRMYVLARSNLLRWNGPSAVLASITRPMVGLREFLKRITSWGANMSVAVLRLLQVKS